MFSKSCEYGLRAVIFIAQQSRLETTVSIATICEAINSPHAFTAKILQQLTKHDIISSIKGPNGGFFITSKATETLPLSAIVALLDGDAVYTNCGLGLQQCNDNKPCPMHFRFVAIREALKNMLQNTTLSMVVNDMESDGYHLKL